MAERRISEVDGYPTRGWSLRDLKLGGPSGWFVEDATDSVLQPFYAALDEAQRLCWTDDRSLAATFPSKRDAERFVVDRLTSAARVVSRR